MAARLGSKEANTFPAGWRLHLYGDFALLDPRGEVVDLPNRKVEALLAILALHRRYGIEREAVVDILWPRKPKDGLANLRQALSLLRKVIGEDALNAPRGHCQLAPSFILECDHEIPSLRNGTSFMPGHEGEWFEQIRLEESLEEANPDLASLPVSDFERTLEWLAMHSPSNVYGVMREAISLTQAIPWDRLSRLLTIPGNDPITSNWRDYWTAYVAENRSDVPTINHRFGKIFDSAVQSSDNALAVEVAYSWAASLIIEGRLSQAEKVAAAGQMFAAKTKNARLVAKINSIRGVVLVHQGHSDEGLAELGRSECLLGDTLSTAHAQGLRAFLEGSIGLNERALETVKSPRRVAAESGHARLALMCSVTESQALARSGHFDESLEIIVPAAQKAGDCKMSYFWPYAYEAAAKTLLMSGEAGLARKHFLVARKARTIRKMPYLGLDSGRLTRADITRISETT